MHSGLKRIHFNVCECVFLKISIRSRLQGRYNQISTWLHRSDCAWIRLRTESISHTKLDVIIYEIKIYIISNKCLTHVKWCLTHVKCHHEPYFAPVNVGWILLNQCMYNFELHEKLQLMWNCIIMNLVLHCRIEQYKVYFAKSI